MLRGEVLFSGPLHTSVLSHYTTGGKVKAHFLSLLSPFRVFPQGLGMYVQHVQTSKHAVKKACLVEQTVGLSIQAPPPTSTTLRCSLTSANLKSEEIRVIIRLAS